MNASTENPGARKTRAKTTATQIRARAEAALEDVRRRSEYLSGPRGKKGA